MHVSSPRHRRGGAPNPIRTRRQSTSPLFAGRSPAPWSPAQPNPLSERTANSPPFPVSPESATTDFERERSPGLTHPRLRLLEYLSGPGWAEYRASRRESVESRTGGVPETPVGTPADASLPAMVMRELMWPGEPITSPRSPVWRGGRWRSFRGMPNLEGRIVGSSGTSNEVAELATLHGRVVEIADEDEGIGHVASDGNGVSEGAVEKENESDEAVEHRESGPGGVHAVGLSVHRDGGGHARPMSWGKYPWVVLMLVLFMLFVPSYKGIF
ncbi:hypothetical protein LX36DRAFT_150899 [Colletotrichum falcatum]|nr:hypothetical protein LX36DRAFT_150899 [Colletotrichum falcatum]